MNVSKKNKKKGVLAKPAQQQMLFETVVKLSTFLKISLQQRTTRTFKQKKLILFIYLALLFAMNAACMGKRKKAPPQQKYKQQVSSCISRILLKTMPLPVHKKYSELLKKTLPSGSTTKTCEQQALENLFTTNNNPSTRTILRKFLTRDTNEHLLSLLSKKIRAETSEHIILQIFPVIVAFGEKASPIFEYLASPNSPCFGSTKSQCKILLLQKSTVFFRSKRKLLKAIYPIISDKTCTPHPEFASFFNHFILPRNESLFTFSLHLVHSHTKTATSSLCTRQFMRILRKKFKDLYLDVHVLKKLLSGPAAHTALLLTKNLPKHLQLTLFKTVQRSIAKGYIKCDSRELGEYLFRVSKKYSQISLAVLKANNTYSIGHTLTCKCLFLWTSLKRPQMRLFFQKVLQKNHADTQVLSKALHLLKCLNLYSPEFLPLFKRILFERGNPHAQTTRMSIPRPATDYVQIIKILFNNTSPNRRNTFLLPIIKKLLQTKHRALCQETALLRILQRPVASALGPLARNSQEWTG